MESATAVDASELERRAAHFEQAFLACSTDEDLIGVASEMEGPTWESILAEHLERLAGCSTQEEVAEESRWFGAECIAIARHRMPLSLVRGGKMLTMPAPLQS